MKQYLAAALSASVLLASCGSDNEKKEEKEPPFVIRENKGEKLFNENCVQCHELDRNKIGPQLKGAFAHWDYDTVRISAFIHNSSKAISSGDPRAVQVAEEFNHTLMTPMPHLSDEDIHAILEYIAE